MKKLISKVLTFALMLAMVVTALVIPNETAKAAEEDANAIVYVKSPESWAKTYLYGGTAGWANNNIIGGWPGVEMKADANNAGWYYLYAPKLAAVLIVNNNNGSQTANIELTAEQLGKNLWIVVNDDNSYTISTTQQTTGAFPTEGKDITHYILGSMNGWSSSNDWKMTLSGDCYTLVKTLSAGDYTFKVNSEYGYWAPADNVSLSLDEEKEVTFTYNWKTGAVEATGAVKPADGYNVLGLGEVWEASDDNAMTQDGDNWVYKKTLAAGTHEYKIKHTGGEWIPSGDNLKVVVETECEVTFTIDPSTKEITATGTGVAKPVVIEDGYYVLGSMNDWTTLPEYKMSEVGDGYILTIELAVGEYEFKIKQEADTDVWYPENNVEFEVVTAGEVTFSIDVDGVVKVYGNGLSTDDITPTGDFSMVLPLVLVLMGGAVVIVASKKRFA